MNNEAFQKLVLDRGQSTKEIARAAVEAEFKKRRHGRKRKQDDYSSDSDDDKNTQKPKKTERSSLLRPSQVKGNDMNESEQTSQVYRDRAKERREGREQESTLHTNNKDVPLPVPIKGLDLTQVHQERAQLGSSHNNTSNNVTVDQEHMISLALPTRDEALQNLKRFAADPSSLSSELSEYLVYFANSSSHDPTKQIICGVEGKTLQRTRLVLNAIAHPSDRRRVWETPRETISANGQDYPLTPLIRKDMIEAIEQAFPTNRKGLEASHPTTGRAQEPSKASPTSHQASRPDPDVDDDDDDDIYCGLDNYVPPKATEA